jgi:signal transduction histidine kinase
METRRSSNTRTSAPRASAPFSVLKVAVTAALIFGIWELAYHVLFMTLLPRPGMLGSHLINLLVAAAGTVLITAYCVQVLRRQNQRLADLDRQKNILVEAIVHDLRSPLTAMLVGLKALTDEDGLLPEDRKLLLTTTRSSSAHLLELVNDLLDISAFEENLPPVASCDVAPEEFIAAGTNILKPLASAGGQTLTLSLPERLPRVRGDEERLRRVVTNLVGNALKFTPAGGTIEVSALHDPDSSRLKVSVKDTGVGVPAEFRDRLFGKFARVEPGQRGGRASTGLGLYFCKLVVEAHGGSIWLESGEKTGATFVFSIPAATPPQGEASRVS